MANDKDFIVKNAVEVGGSMKTTVGTLTADKASTSYDLSNMSYTGNSKSTVDLLSQTSPQDLFFKPDGTKGYILGDASDLVYEIDLSTAWDLSTATYSSVNLSIASQDTGMNGLFFKSDGTSLYVLGGGSGDSVYQYNMTTAWDLSTASYASKSLSVSTQTTGPKGLHFKTDGTALFIGDGDNFFQYTLSTAWDVSTGSYASKTIEHGLPSPAKFDMNADGTKLFLSRTNESITEFNLSTAWDISTATEGTTFESYGTLPISTFFNTLQSSRFFDSGTRLYALGSSNDRIYQFDVGKKVQELDLSTGNYFTKTMTASEEYSFVNPADAQSFQLEVTGANFPINDYFSTTLYTGNGTSQTITNDIDLDGEGGMVWIKARNTDLMGHIVTDTERGVGKALVPNVTNAEDTNHQFGYLSDFNSNGFTITNGSSNANRVNSSSYNYASWTWRKDPRFFDIQTYTGNGTAGRTVSHNLNAAPGMVIVKKTDTAEDWAVLHRSLSAANGILYLNKTDIGQNTPIFNDEHAGDSTFAVGNHPASNDNSATYVAYLFAHDPEYCVCSFYYGSGTTSNIIELGWEPQWLLIKRADTNTGNWQIFDNKRGGLPGGSDSVLYPNLSNDEGTGLTYVDTYEKGFILTSSANAVNATSNTYIYVAIRKGENNTLTWPTGLSWTGTPLAPATGEKDIFTISTDDGGTTYNGLKTGDNFS